MKFVLWSNFEWCEEDYTDRIAASLPPEVNVSCEQKWALMRHLNQSDYDKMKERLCINTNAPIVALATIRTPDDIATGYRIIDNGSLSECLEFSTEFATFFVDDNGEFGAELMSDETITDVVFRAVSPNISPDTLKEALQSYARDEQTADDIKTLTRPLGEQAAICLDR